MRLDPRMRASSMAIFSTMLESSFSKNSARMPPKRERVRMLENSVHRFANIFMLVCEERVRMRENWHR